MSITVGIDASRNRSGGAIRHLVGVLSAEDPRTHGICSVHVWSYSALLDALPDAPWITKHAPEALGGSLLQQAWWQRRSLPRDAKQAGVDILLNTDAGTVCRARPAVTMSRDMLQYEPGELSRYPAFSRAWMRNVALRFVQGQSFRNADGVIFLTEYAARVIQSSVGSLPRVAMIPHGVGPEFARTRRPKDATGPLRVIYVSQTEAYKHQWHVVRAVSLARARGHDLELVLAGGGAGAPQRRLDEEIGCHDPDGVFVHQIGAVAQRALPELLAGSDLFVFASSCENMPNTLVEGMAAGLPIACSNRGPMPEVLGDCGLYFDPEVPESIAAAIELLASDAGLRDLLAKRAAERAAMYSWARCARETWKFLIETYEAVRRNCPAITIDGT